VKAQAAEGSARGEAHAAPAGGGCRRQVTQAGSRTGASLSRQSDACCRVPRPRPGASGAARGREVVERPYGPLRSKPRLERHSSRVIRRCFRSASRCQGSIAQGHSRPVLPPGAASRAALHGFRRTDPRRGDGSLSVGSVDGAARWVAHAPRGRCIAQHPQASSGASCLEPLWRGAGSAASRTDQVPAAALLTESQEFCRNSVSPVLQRTHANERQRLARQPGRREGCVPSARRSRRALPSGRR